MLRYNPFNMIHKALRNMLYDAASGLQQTWFGDTKEAEAALEKVETIIYHFERHAHHEDSYVLPAIEQFDSGLVHSFEAEHEKDLSLANKLKNLINIYRNVNFEEERINAGSALCKAFIDFMIFNLEHMGKEEMLVNAVLWRNYTDEQLLGINQQIIANIPTEEMAAISHWMIRSINDNEAIKWLSALKAAAPSFVLQSIMATAEKTLPGHRFEKIKEGVEAKSMAA